MNILSRLRSLFERKRRARLEKATEIVDQLIDLGFLKWVPPAEMVSVRQQLIECVRDGYLDSDWDDDCTSIDRRSYRADAEDLAEGDVGTCLRRIVHCLADEGVVLETIDDIFTQGHTRYEVGLNGKQYLIYDLSDTPMDQIWLAASRQLLDITNSLLTQAGSMERLYGLDGGNDFRIVFLTEPMREVIKSNGEVFGTWWKPLTSGELS